MVKASVLVVDDNPSFRASVTDVLEEAGYHVLAAASGAEAMALLGEAEVDLLVLDLMMPGVNGQQLSRTLRQSGRLAHVPILALSGAGPEQVLQADVDWFLSKPVELKLLLSTVEHLLQTALLRRPAKASESQATLRS